MPRFKRNRRIPPPGLPGGAEVGTLLLDEVQWDGGGDVAAKIVAIRPVAGGNPSSVAFKTPLISGSGANRCWHFTGAVWTPATTIGCDTDGFVSISFPLTINSGDKMYLTPDFGGLLRAYNVNLLPWFGYISL